MNKRLQEIIRKNSEFEKEAPYNFCDRWCERCAHEKQVRCTLYKDERDRKQHIINNGPLFPKREKRDIYLDNLCRD